MKEKEEMLRERYELFQKLKQLNVMSTGRDRVVERLDELEKKINSK